MLLLWTTVNLVGQKIITNVISGLDSIENSMVSKDISASPAERHPLTLHVHLAIISRRILKNGYYILNV
ncbi:hypothetical protein KTC95_22265 (plasmid) [Clostridium estertheticum]|nr:hypothetical protein [Clostridium estertheticum]WLC82078.1 hypothetical protein KTC98_23020 [Clostridium estertheticum]WLC91081.1 hypothetical protein KTC95_22265 [Clostridium estertheticum]